jgi:caffeoyl-CoA O-methyltransferase
MDVDSRIARYAVEHTSPLDSDLEAVADATRVQTEAPQMMSGLVEARLLQVLVRQAKATRVLEVGTFTGLGALAMAESVGPGGKVTTLEADPENAALARAHIADHPAGGRVEMLFGDALHLLTTLRGPFDLAYVDAWKTDYPAYFELVLPLLSREGIMVFDNVLQGGAALEANNPVGAFNDMVHADTRVDNTLLTVGDGVLIVSPRTPDARQRSATRSS